MAASNRSGVITVRRSRSPPSVTSCSTPAPWTTVRPQCRVCPLAATRAISALQRKLTLSLNEEKAISSTATPTHASTPPPLARAFRGSSFPEGDARVGSASAGQGGVALPKLQTTGHDGVGRWDIPIGNAVLFADVRTAARLVVLPCLCRLRAAASSVGSEATSVSTSTRTGIRRCLTDARGPRPATLWPLHPTCNAATILREPS